MLAAMAILWAGSAALAGHLESQGNPRIEALGVVGANMEGKEARFGAPVSGIFAASTTGTSTGAVDSSHDSFTPLGGAVPLVNMMLGEVSPGGVGAGLYGILVFAILSVFVAGLMVGRTPEYLGKRIGAQEMKLVMLYLLAVPTVVLGFSGVAVLLNTVRDVSIFNPGAHGLSEVVYAYTSASNNNGSAFGGLTRQHGLVQHDARRRDALRSLRPHRPGPRHRRRARPQAARPSVGRNVPDRHADVHRPPRRGDPHRRRPHLPPDARARADPGAPAAMTTKKATSMFEPAIVGDAALDAFRKLDPRHVVRNPVMFLVEVGSLVVTVLFVKNFGGASAQENVFAAMIALWLWVTVLFANFAEAMAEGRGKAQAATLRKTRAETLARKRRDDGSIVEVPSVQLVAGDVVVVTAGDLIPADGDVVEGIATVDESAITGESAPVIRESGGDRSAVTGGTRVLSDQIVVLVTAKPGESFLDRMIALVEGAVRRKTPNEIALDILLAGLTIIFLIAVVTLQPFAIYSDARQSTIVLVALLVCLIPTTIGALLSAIGIAGWTVSSSATCSRSRAARWRRPGTATCSCSTRRARSRSGTARRPTSSPPRASPPSSSPTRPSSRASPTRRRKGDRSSCSRRSGSDFASATSTAPSSSRSPRTRA